MSGITGSTSTPSRFLAGNSADPRNLALDIFGGEVLTAFDLETITLTTTQTRTLGGGMRSARFN